ncbi:GNAT family N-acetyltransferase [Rickettsiales bacterium LUAb2]
MQKHEKFFNSLFAKELYQIMQLRMNVFMLEQKNLYKDLDNRDINSTHIFYKDFTDNVIAYTRVIPKEFSEFNSVSLGRVCVHPNNRQQNLGRQLIVDAVDYIKNNINTDSIIISAKDPVLDFYKKFGFNKISEVFDEDGIRHNHLELKL